MRRKKRHFEIFYGFVFSLLIGLEGIHFYFYIPPVTKDVERENEAGSEIGRAHV